MTLTGTLERPTIDLTSEEGSRTPGEIAAELVGSTNTETALTLLSADLLGVTGRAIGLDAFRVERGDFEDRDFRDYQEDPTLIGNNRTDPTTRLTVGKRLSDQVEFTVSQNLRENGKATFIVSYFPRRNIEMRALSRDSGTVSLGIRHQVTFGGGESQAAIGTARPADDQRDHVQRRRSGDRIGGARRDQDRGRRRVRFPRAAAGHRSHPRGVPRAGLPRGARPDPARRGRGRARSTVEFIVDRGPRTILRDRRRRARRRAWSRSSKRRGTRTSSISS